MIASNELMHKRLATLVFVLTALFNSGCGFHLQGQTPLSDTMVEPHLDDSNLELIRRSEEELRFGSVSPVVDAVISSEVIELFWVAYLREVGTLNLHTTVTGRVLQYEFVCREQSDFGGKMTCV